jgi:glycosyltransferase involved in cell wall biosynthesis
VTTISVLLTPRAYGGHEKALFGWLADAARLTPLQARVHLPPGRLFDAAAAAGVPTGWLHAQPSPWRALAGLPRGTPLLLAPGVLHAGARLLAATWSRGHRPWVYVPMTYTAQQMGYRVAAARDALLAPLLRRVAGWITIDAFQQQQLVQRWRVRAPVHVLPNVVRLPTGAGPAWPAPDAAGCLRVAQVGRFDLAMKGLDWLADLLHTRPAPLARCRWLFQGEGAGAPRLHALAAELGAQQLRVQPFAPLDDALACSDVLLLASRYEGFPLVALEATARGWPVVATHEARLDGLLPASSLFAYRDAAGLARALDSLRSPAARTQAVGFAQQRLAELLPPARYESALRALVAAWSPAAPQGGAMSCEAT